MTTYRSARRSAPFLAMVALLAACAAPLQPITLHSLVPRSGAEPAPRQAEPVLASPAVVTPRLLTVARVTLPEEVDRAELVVRGVDGDVALLDTERWAEPLKAQLPRATALALARRIPGLVASAYPALPPPGAAWRLSLEVQRFELQTGASPRALLRVLYTLKPPEGEAMVALADVDMPATASTPAALTAAMAQALGRVADQLALGFH